ncbi:hypothetical protein AgCh_017224 [Apium graveolens]
MGYNFGFYPFGHVINNDDKELDVSLGPRKRAHYIYFPSVEWDGRENGSRENMRLPGNQSKKLAFGTSHNVMKVKMHLHLLSQDEAYVDYIERGPHVPMRAVTGNEPSVPKPRHEWSDLDIEQVRKDKKAMNILFNGVDGDIFDNIINCKTAKDVWDTIQIICDGTEQVRENKMRY